MDDPGGEERRGEGVPLSSPSPSPPTERDSTKLN